MINKSFYGVTLLIFLCFVSNAVADSKKRSEFMEEMKPYILNALTIANANQSIVRLDLESAPQGDDPQWYGGNWLAVLEIVKDLYAHVFHNFPSTLLDCLDISMKFPSSKCENSWGLPNGIEVGFRFPLQTLHTHPAWQQRYLEPPFYSLLESIFPDLWYPYARTARAPLANIHATIQDTVAQQGSLIPPAPWLPFVPFHGFLLPNLSFNSSEFDLEAADERYRFAGGKMGDLDQLEYSMGPTLLQGAWFVLTQIYPVLKVLPLSPPPELPAPFVSNDPMVVFFTREPLLGFLLYNDETIREDLLNWFLKPEACVEWMMNKNRTNIPFDLYEVRHTNRGLGINLNLFNFLAEPLEPMDDEDLEDYDRMCIPNWGGTIPFTVFQNLHNVDFIMAGKNFMKAIRLGVGMYKTFLEDNNGGQYVRWFPYDREKDAYQLTYPDIWECKDLGDPGIPDGNNVLQASRHAGKSGLYSMTHWYHLGSDCVGLGDISELLNLVSGSGF